MSVMNKFVTILISVAVSGFLALNLYLLFNEKSNISKSHYVQQYERVSENDYREELAKATLVAPLETYTVYVEEEDAVNSWLVQEGSPVTVGQELALLNTERAEGEREVWEAEREALLQERTALEQLSADLTVEKFETPADSASTIDQQGWIAEVDERTTIELDLKLGMNIGITQEGAYSQTITAVEQQVAEVSRQLTIIEAKLAQDPSKQALISPTEGVVSEVKRHGTALAVDVFSEEKILVTYVKDEEWKAIEQGQEVKIQEDMTGTVLSISEVPTQNEAQLANYQKLQEVQTKEPLAYYEVQITPDESLQDMPYGSEMEVKITIDEALEAVPVYQEWLVSADEASARVTKLDASGKGMVVTAAKPFVLKNHALLTDEIRSGDVVLNQRLKDADDFKVFLSFPRYMPTAKEWKSYGWRNYLKAMLLK